MSINETSLMEVEYYKKNIWLFCYNIRIINIGFGYNTGLKLYIFIKGLY